MKQQGFTVIELLITISFLIAVGVVLFFQLDGINTQQINSDKKVAINAMYFSLEEEFYPKNNYYPEYIEENTLKTMDQELLIDPFDIKIGEAGSAYRYEPTDCVDGKCKSYTLRATLDKEEDFIKESRNK